jgi:hypothetical protein
MKTRIAMWASLGFLVAGCWAVYAFARVTPITSAQPIVYALARVTQPIALASLYFHFGVRFYWVMLANAATYALIGLMVEGTRRGFGRTSTND